MNLVAVFCILSWRVFWMTMINRIQPSASPEVAFTKLELWLLDELVEDRTDEEPQRTLAAYLTNLARPVDTLARAHVHHQATK